MTQWRFCSECSSEYLVDGGAGYPMGFFHVIDLLFFAHTLRIFPFSRQPVKRAEQEHEIAGIAQFKARVLGKAYKVTSVIATQVVS